MYKTWSRVFPTPKRRDGTSEYYYWLEAEWHMNTNNKGKIHSRPFSTPKGKFPRRTDHLPFEKVNRGPPNSECERVKREEWNMFSYWGDNFSLILLFPNFFFPPRTFLQRETSSLIYTYNICIPSFAGWEPPHFSLWSSLGESYFLLRLPSSFQCSCEKVPTYFTW